MVPRMPKRKLPANLTVADVALLERLIDSGALIAVPPKRMGKARPVISAALADGGKHIRLYLSPEAVELAER
jgi:hypothetical protein